MAPCLLVYIPTYLPNYLIMRFLISLGVQLLSTLVPMYYVSLRLYLSFILMVYGSRFLEFAMIRSKPT